MRQDLVFAARVFRRQPGLFGLTVAGLALAIAISASGFSIVSAVTVFDAGIVKPESVVRLELEGERTMAALGVTSSPLWPRAAYIPLASGMPSREALTAFASFSGRVALASDDGDVPQVGVRAVSGNYFSLLGGRGVVGRTLIPSDDRPGAPLVAMLSYAFWKLRAGSDPNVVGRQVFLDGVPLTIVGVSERRFVGPGNPHLRPALWVPFGTQDALWRVQQRSGDLWNPFVEVVARIDEERTAAQIAGEATAIASSTVAPADANARVAVQVMAGDVRKGIDDEAVFMIALGLLIVGLGVANVTNLLVASAASRGREIGTRLALGATRGRIVRQLLAESVLIALVAGGLGLGLAYWLAPVLASLLKLPMVDVSPDWRVYLWVLLVAGTAGLLAGLAPARFIRKGNLIASLKTDRLSAPTGVRAPRRARTVLLVLQAATAVVLLAAAALLTRGMVRATTLEPGFDTDRLINVRVTLPRGTDEAVAAAYWDAAIDRVQRFPDVAAIALALRAPFDGIGWQSRGPTGRPVQRNETSAQYFAATGIRLIRGRIYTDDEARTGAPVALISARVAQEFWAGEDPLGATLERVWGPDPPGDSSQSGLARRPHGTRIIGVVSDAVTSLRRHDVPQVYMPIARSNLAGAQMIVAVRADPARLITALGNAIRAVNSDAAVSLSLVRMLLANERQPSLSLARFALILSGTALLLACIGIFGLTAFAVAERRHEISIRMALGATTARVVALIMRDSLTPVIAGLAAGVIAALFAGRILSSFLYGIEPRDPIALIGAIVLLLGAAVVATFVPARRAVRVDPLRDLKAP